MAMNVGGLNINTGIVSGAELEKVSREIFGAAQNVSVKPQTDASVSINKFRPVETTGINLFSQNTDLALTKQVASTKAGLDVNLSQSAISNIQALNSQALTLQAANMQATKLQTVDAIKNIDGKVTMPADALGVAKGDLRSVFSVSDTFKFIDTASLEKDKKGSNPFSYVPPVKGKQKKQEDRLSIFA